VRLDGHHHHKVALSSRHPHACQELPVQTTYIGTPLCGRARTHEFTTSRVLQGTQMGKQIWLCECGAIKNSRETLLGLRP